MSNYTATTKVGSERVWPDNDKYRNEFPNHATAEQHYYSAKKSVEELNIRLAAFVAHFGDLPVPGQNPAKPPGTEQKFGSSNGHLWKPGGDHTGLPVFVMDKKYTQGQVDGGANLAGRVSLWSAKGKQIEILQWSSSANGGRGNHRSKIKASALSVHAPLTLRWNHEGRDEYLVVPDPTKRWE